MVTDTGAGYGSNEQSVHGHCERWRSGVGGSGGIGLALSAGSLFADIAGNLADSTADDASAYNETYTLDNTPLGAPGASLTTDTGATAGHTSDEAVTVTAAVESYGVRYSLDGSSFVSDPGSLPFSGDGSYTVYVQQEDIAGNWSGLAQVSFTLDTTSPSGATVARRTGDSGVDTDGEVHFTVTLNEPVDPASVGVEDFVMTKTGMTGTEFTVSPESGAATDTFTVTVPYTGEGTINLALGAAAEFIDRAGNTGTTFTASSASVDVDNVGMDRHDCVSESVKSTPALVTVSVSFDEALGGSPTAANVIGALTTPGLTLSGTPTADGNTYTATFVATAATNSTGNQISIAAGAFSDANGNGTSAATSTSYEVDSVTPTITGFDVSGPDGTYGPGDTISISATASEPPIAGSAIRATLTNGEVVTLTADSGGTTLAGSYTVHADDTSLTDLNVSSFALGDGTGASLPTRLQRDDQHHAAGQHDRGHTGHRGRHRQAIGDRDRAGRGRRL